MKLIFYIHNLFYLILKMYKFISISINLYCTVEIFESFIKDWVTLNGIELICI